MKRDSEKITVQWMAEFAKGNPGCVSLLQKLWATPEGHEAVLTMAEYGIIGSRAYQLWNDCCGRDVQKVVEILALSKEGKITQEEICNHVYLPFGEPFDIEEIRKRKPKPNSIMKKVRLKTDPSWKGMPGMEKLYKDRMCNQLIEQLFMNSEDIGKTFEVEIREVHEMGERYLVARKREVQHG